MLHVIAQGRVFPVTGFRTQVHTSVSNAIEATARGHAEFLHGRPACVMVDGAEPTGELLRAWRDRLAPLPVIALVTPDDVAAAVEPFRLGAWSVLPHDADAAELEEALQGAFAFEREQLRAWVQWEWFLARLHTLTSEEWGAVERLFAGESVDARGVCDKLGVTGPLRLVNLFRRVERDLHAQVSLGEAIRIGKWRVDWN